MGSSLAWRPCYLRANGGLTCSHADEIADGSFRRERSRDQPQSRRAHGDGYHEIDLTPAERLRTFGLAFVACLPA